MIRWAGLLCVCLCGCTTLPYDLWRPLPKKCLFDVWETPEGVLVGHLVRTPLSSSYARGRFGARVRLLMMYPGATVIKTVDLAADEQEIAIDGSFILSASVESCTAYEAYSASDLGPL